MINYEDFLRESRALLIAPAGYGKTHAIVECLKLTKGRQLILTHTHAGVAALRDRLRKIGIHHSCYRLETISSIAQKIAVAYTRFDEIPPQEDARLYFPWILHRANELSESRHIQRMMKASFSGVFVDEYQDCTVTQHRLIMSLSRGLPLRALGDPMQGIFGFLRDDPIVDFDADLKSFVRYELTEPRRWSATNPLLGAEIADIRRCLESEIPLESKRYKAIRFITVSPVQSIPEIVRLGNLMAKKGSALMIVSDSAGRPPRTKIARLFGGRCGIIEAVDDREFYELANLADGLSEDNGVAVLYGIASRVFFKSQLDEWLKTDGVKKKRKSEDEKKSISLAAAVHNLRECPSFENLLEALVSIKTIPGVQILGHEKYYSIVRSLRIAVSSTCSVVDAMHRLRNHIRIVGRRVGNFSVGSTLLTKGLEFDNVIVLDCDPGFNLGTVSGRRNFYVAISRARKSLCIVRYDKTAYVRSWLKVARQS